MRTGQQYLEAIQDGRRVYMDGELVGPLITEHPAFAGITQSMAQLYDIAHDPANDMSFTDPETGLSGNKIYMIPRSQADLKARREAMIHWHKAGNGLVGRSPDHVAGFLTAFANAPEVFARGGARFGENVTRWYRQAVTDDLYFSYVIIPPQVDRTKTAQGQEDAFLQVGVCAERADGIVVRGAQMLGTGAAISDYLFVSCITPLKTGDEDYALSFVVKLDTPGLKLYCRPSYAEGKSSTFDYPLSTRFDESDALLVFDDVFIPWENVFVYRNLELLRAQFFETGAHILGNNQAQIRLAIKMKFIAGLARKIAATTRVDQIPAVQEKLGELASLTAIVEGMELASEAECTTGINGIVLPHPRFLYGTMGLQAELYPRAIGILRELAGGGVLQVPSSFKELLNPETAPDIQRYIRAAGVPSEERIKLFKLAWDMFGSEFGGRHQQYEMFYAGAPYVAKGYCYRNYQYEEVVGMVDAFMSTYELDKPRTRETSAVAESGGI